MPTHEPNLKLGENHRRVISIVLRNLEHMCEEIERWIERPSGTLLDFEQDLSIEQPDLLRALLAELRGEIRRISTEVELNRGSKSRKGAIRALLSVHLVQLEESESPRLKGYGPLTEEAKLKLDQELGRLHTLLEQMVAVVERR
jgi:hypothetical protein